MTDKVKQLEDKLDQVLKKVDFLQGLVSPNATYIGDNKLLTQTLHGVKYIIYADDLISTPNMVVYRQWEAHLSRLLYKLLDSDSIFIDVGANFGYFTCLAGTIIGDHGDGRVIAVEPNPRMLELVRKNIRINWGMSPIDITEGALDQNRRTTEMVFPVELSANATLANVDWGDQKVIKEEIECYTIEDVVSEENMEGVSLIKIDVEGFEFNVLKGMASLLEKNRDAKVILEWSMPQMKDAQINIQEYIGFLKDHFSHAYFIEELITEVSIDTLGDYFYKDLLFCNEKIQP